jgi:ribosome-associated toxin RatA of RatAB toxin-antitoxin module
MSRRFDASPDAIHELIHDVGAFMRAGGFDEVVVEDDRIDLTNRVGIATIEVQLEIFDEDDTALSYRQRDGIFEEMTSTYTLTPTDDGCEVTANTEFAIDVALVGDLMDATIIKRQRRRELEAQFDWLESQLDG